MSLSAPSRQGHLAVDLPVAAITVTPGVLAAVSARVSLQLRPTPLKGTVEVASSDPVFAIVQVTEVRRAERWITLEVRGAYHAPEPRAVTLTYSIDGLSVEQTLTFAPSAAPEASKPVSQRYIPFEDGEPATASPTDRQWSQPSPVVAEPAPRREGSVAVEVAPPLRRIGAGLGELLCAATATAVGSIAFIFIAVIPYIASGCESDPPPGSNCATADEAIVNALVAVWAAGIPLYHAVSAMIGGGLAYRVLGLRILRREAFYEQYPIEAELGSHRPGALRGLCRTLVAYAGVCCIGIGYLWMFTNNERRGWHDLAAGTVVIRVLRR